MIAQGYGIENNIIYQNNQSAMRIEKNGSNPCTGTTGIYILDLSS